MNVYPLFIQVTVYITAQFTRPRVTENDKVPTDLKMGNEYCN